jgi:hypothetical protein
MRIANIAPIFRFYQHVKRVDGCLVWTGRVAVNGDYRRGYFYMGSAGKKKFYVLAAKWFYEWNHGPVPEGKELGHFPECKHKPLCVVHVRPVTHRENLMEAPTCITAIAASKTHCPQGHEYTVGNIFKRSNRPNDRECLICKNEKRRVPGGPGLPGSKRMHCPQGHEYNEENTCYSSGRRKCRACASIRGKEKRRLAKLSLDSITNLRSN